MIRLEAAQRLMLTADGEWFDALTDDLKEQYVKEHPDSKYAKGWKRRSVQPSSPKPVVKSPPSKAPVSPGGSPKAKQAIKKLPAHAQKFVKTGGTKSGSKARKALAKNVKKNASKIAKSTLKDNKQLAAGLLSLPRILQDKGSKKDWKAARKIGLTVLASAGIAAALGVSGPAGFLTFMAIKHLAGPALGSLVKKAVTRSPVATGDKVKHEASKAWAATGNKGISPYGYWKDDVTWVSETEEEWDEHYEDEDRGYKIPKHHAALIVAADEAPDEEATLQRIIEGFADFAADGDIPDNTWDSAVEEMASDSNDSENVI